MATPAIGRKAPRLTLPDGRTLSDLAGSPVVIFFYPQDDTETCTMEATDFSSLSAEFGKLGAVVIGVSPDSADSHAKFARKYGLDLLLVADTELKAAKAYGVWGDKVLFGRAYKGIIRTTFLVDPAGRVARIWSKVRVKNHAADVLAAAAEITPGGTAVRRAR
ncbi:MAG: peroxiredoxin [Rhizobiaceae bacterium]|nr:peroxiredoxin [Rhizobiaceae bacterium]